MKDIIEQFEKNNHIYPTFTLNDGELPNDIKQDIDFYNILKANLKQKSKSEIIDIFLNTINVSRIEAIELNYRSMGSNTKKQLNFLISTFNYLISDHDRMEHNIMYFFEMLLKILNTTIFEERNITDIALLTLGIELIEYLFVNEIVDETKEYTDEIDKIRSKFIALASTSYVFFMDSQQMDKNTYIHLMLNLIKNHDTYFETEKLFEMIFGCIVLANKDNLTLVEKVAEKLYFHEIEYKICLEAVLLYAKDGKEAFYKYVEEHTFGDETVLIAKLLIATGNAALTEKISLEFFYKCNPDDDNLFRMYDLLKFIYSSLIVDEAKLIETTKYVITNITDEFEISNIVIDLVTECENFDEYKEHKKDIFKIMKEKMSVPRYFFTLCDIGEEKAWIEYIKNISTKEEMLEITDFISHETIEFEDMGDYNKELYEAIKNNKVTDTKMLDSVKVLLELNEEE